MVQQHRKDVLALQQQLRNQNTNTPFCLGHAKTASNTTRNLPYKRDSRRIDISHLDRVLEVDIDAKTAWVQPRISMYALCRKLLAFNLMPKVVPEFKGITVGGAINGCGGESNSHKDGLFHDNCLEYEVLLGNGELITASNQEHSDLFHAIHGSYGSLGVVTSAKIALTEATPYVRLRYRRFAAIAEALSYLKSCRASHFIEGIVYSEYDIQIVEAEQVNTALQTHFSQNSFGAPWFYQHVKECPDGHEESMTLLDYLFRHDKGAFWMGAYVLRPKIAYRLLVEGILAVTKKQVSLHSESSIKDPSSLLRIVTSPLVQSQPLYRLLHLAEHWIQKQFIVQDLTVPESQAETLFSHLFKECPLFPLWICPVSVASSDQLFCPSALATSDLMCINVGVYGMVQNGLPTKKVLSGLEAKIQELGGRKWLYTNSEYTPFQFWSIYPEERYRNLREKYQATTAFVSIENKVL